MHPEVSNSVDQSRFAQFWRRVAQRFPDVSVDGLIQIGVVTTVVAALTAAGTWIAHPHGVWLQRAIGALVATSAIALILGVIGTLRRWIKLLARRRAQALGEKGFLDHKLDAENALQSLVPIVNKMTKIMNDVGPQIQNQAAKLRNALSTKAQIRVSKQTSQIIDKFSRRFERIRTRLAAAGDSLYAGLTGWSPSVRNAETDEKALAHFLQVLKSTERGMQTATDGIKDYIAAAKTSKGVSRDLNTAIARHIEILESIRTAILTMRRACAETYKTLGGPAG